LGYYLTGVGQDDHTGACPACPVAPEDGTGVGSGNPTGVESLTIPLGLAPLGTCFIKKSVEGRGNIQF